jgi:hypothetical protein
LTVGVVVAALADWLFALLMHWLGGLALEMDLGEITRARA